MCIRDRTVGAKVAGIVLSMVPTRGPDAYAYAYGYGYGQGYGYVQGQTKSQKRAARRAYRNTPTPTPAAEAAPSSPVVERAKRDETPLASSDSRSS